MASASRAVGYLVRHSLWCSRFPVHCHPGCGMEGGTQEDMELQ